MLGLPTERVRVELGDTKLSRRQRFGGIVGRTGRASGSALV